MPTMINGTGTAYWGRKNVVTALGTCPHCGSENASLTSYDTFYCLSLLFIMKVPIRKRRIMDECEDCDRHSYMSLKAYRAERDEAIDDAAARYKAAPHDPEAAEQFIGTIVGFREKDLLKQAAGPLENACRNHKENLLLLASAHFVFFSFADEERCLRAALALGDDPDTRLKLGINLILQKRFDEAAPLLVQCYDPENVDDAGVCYLLAKGYQTDGNHEEALRVLQQIESTWPDMAEMKEHQNLVTESERHRVNGKRTRHKNLFIQPPKDKATNGCLLSLPFLLPSLFFLAVLSMFYFGLTSEDIYLINGTKHTYTVSFDGQNHVLKPGDPKKVNASLGIHTLTYDTKIGEMRERTIELTGGMGKFLSYDVTVVNPDLTAVIYFEEAEYALQGVEAADPVTRWETGHLIKVYEDIDYPFEEMPETISISESTKKEKRRHIAFTEMEYFENAASILAQENGEVLIRFIMDSLDFDPEHATLPDYLAKLDQQYETGLAKPFLKTRLDDRPLRLAWHSAYQRMQTVDKMAELREEYRALYDADPNSKAAAYLLGILLGDLKQAEALLEQAATGENPIALAQAHLFMNLYEQGEMEKALAMYQLAVANPENERFKALVGPIMAANGHYAAVASAFRDEVDNNAGSVNAHYQYIAYTRIAGAPADIGAHVDTLIEALKDEEVSKEEISAYLTAVDAFAARDPKRFLAACKDQTFFQLEALLLAGELKEALTHIVENGANTNHLLILAALATKRGNNALADRALETASPRMALDSFDVPLLDILAGKRDPSDIFNLVVGSERKLAMLLLLGRKYPNIRKRCDALARKLNTTPRFPYFVGWDILR